MALSSREEYLPLRDMFYPTPSAYDQFPRPTDTKSTPFQLRPKKRKLEFWAWEWTALIVSFLAVTASAITLRIFDGRPIPQWSWHSKGISVNSVLSLLSTLSRASLLMPIDECMGQLMWLRFAAQQHRLADVRMYNEATRGPLGALKLMWRQKGLGLGCLGSILLIGSLGIGTAQQQLLSYPTRYSVDPAINSTVTRAQIFSAYQNTTTLDSTTPTMSYTLLSSIYSAALLSNTNSTSSDFEVLPFFTCTSGACTFPTFTTLGVCSECHDTTDQVQSSCNDTAGSCFATFHNLTASAWKLNNINFTNTILNQSSIELGSTSTSFSAKSPFTILVHLQANSSSWPPKYTGTQCALSWCAKTINATVTNGVYAEHVLKEYENYTTDDSDGLSIVGPNSTIFRITAGAHQSITGVSGIAHALKGWAKSTPSGDNRLFSSDLMQGFSSYANISDVIDRVAASLTNRIRDLDTTMPPQDGQTWGPESYIRVRWPWLLYPLTLWTLSLIFLLLISFRSRNGTKRLGMRAWGANPLALMFYGLDDETKRRVKDGEWEQMTDLSERLWVKLERGGEGIRLRGQRVDS